MKYPQRIKNSLSTIQNNSQCLLFSIPLVLFFPFFSFAQENTLKPGASYHPYPAVVHIHSNISEKGVYPLPKLAGLAADEGVRILVFSDTFLKRWEYGLPFLPNILKFFLEEHSVTTYGVRRYLKELNKTQREFLDLIILEGVEVTPFYWWSGNLFKNTLTLNDASRHMLVIGLKNARDYSYMPVFGNKYLFPRLKDIPCLLFPGLIIWWGVFLLRGPGKRRFLGLALNTLGILIFLGYFPFSASSYHPGSGQRGFLPCQNLIDYVNKKGGLVFWAHPNVAELTSSGKFARINFYTPSYPEALTLTEGYTAFGVNFMSGASRGLIIAGGRWDNVLTAYCKGKRRHPVFAVGEADYRGGKRLGIMQNMLLLREFGYAAAYEALRNGKFYISYHPQKDAGVFLSQVYIKDTYDLGARPAFIADELKVKGRPKIYIKGAYKMPMPDDLNIEIIRNGQVIQRVMLGKSDTFDLEFQDDTLPRLWSKNYYRINFFSGSTLLLATNPIFIEI